MTTSNNQGDPSVRLETFLNSLSERERGIVKCRFGLETYKFEPEEIARIFKTSVESIEREIEIVEQKLREARLLDWAKLQAGV